MANNRTARPTSSGQQQQWDFEQPQWDFEQPQWLDDFLTDKWPPWLEEALKKWPPADQPPQAENGSISTKKQP